MSELFVETGKMLSDLAQRNDSVLIAYSGGKESLCCAALCHQFFRRIVGYHCYLVPGMRLVKDRMDFARQRFGMEIVEYPGTACLQGLSVGYYSDPDARYPVKPPNILEYGAIASRQTGIKLIMSGARIEDYRNRAAQLRFDKRKNIIFPLARWSKSHVELWLRQKGIPLPASDGLVSSGFNLKKRPLLWLHDDHRDDFRRVARLFPYVWAVPMQRALQKMVETGAADEKEAS